jgi:hypothetical protein
MHQKIAGHEIGTGNFADMRIEVSGKPIGGIQNFSITETRRTFETIDTYGNPDIYPSPGHEISGSINRIRYDGRSIIEALGHDAASIGETGRFTLEIIDENSPDRILTTTLSNVLLTEYTSSYIGSDSATTIDTCTFVAGDISTTITPREKIEPKKYETDEINKRRIIDYIQKATNQNMKSFIGQPMTQYNIAAIKSQLANNLRGVFSPDIKIDCQTDPYDPTVLTFNIDLPLPYGNVHVMHFGHEESDWDIPTTPDILIQGVPFDTKPYWDWISSMPVIIQDTKPVIDFDTIGYSQTELLASLAKSKGLPIKRESIPLDSFSSPPTEIAKEQSIEIAEEKDDTGLSFLMILGAIVGGLFETYCQATKTESVRVSTQDALSDTDITEAVKEMGF